MIQQRFIMKTMSGNLHSANVFLDVLAPLLADGVTRIAHRTLVPLKALFVLLVIPFYISAPTAVAQPTGWDAGISGVLLVGKFRTQQQLTEMSFDDQRNTLITELVGRTKSTVGYYQSLNNANLAGAGALLVYLRETGSRADQHIKTMSADDMRNTVIVEVAAQGGCGRGGLQALSNMDLVIEVLNRPTGCLR